MATMTPLAWHNLVHNRVRSGVAIAGVTFAIVLMFMQLGFLEAVKIAATLSCDVLDYDLCIRSVDYDHFSDARLFSQVRLQQAKGVEGVDGVTPLMTAIYSWRHPENGEQRAILAQGVEPLEPTFLDETQGLLPSLIGPQTMLVDKVARRQIGPANGKYFSDLDIDRHVEINHREMRIAGLYARGPGLAAAGGIILSRREYYSCLHHVPRNQISLGLVRLAAGTEPERVADRLRDVLPRDVEVLTRAEFRDFELDYWVWETNYGFFFYSGVVMAFIVGIAIVYQVLVSDVSSLLPEYATLKAMGYSNRYIVSVILKQSTLLAIISYAIGLAIAQVLYIITSWGAGIPVKTTWLNLAIVLGASLLMCILSGLAAVRKAFKADPAELFK